MIPLYAQKALDVLNPGDSGSIALQADDPRRVFVKKQDDGSMLFWSLSECWMPDFDTAKVFENREAVVILWRKLAFSAT